MSLVEIIQKKNLVEPTALQEAVALSQSEGRDLGTILLEKGLMEEFNKIEVVLRGNYLIKQDWK